MATRSSQAAATQLAIQVTLHKKLPYDAAADFIPLALVASVPFVLWSIRRCR